MRFDKKYFAYFLLLLIVEIAIAFWVENPVIRGNLGDVLVVILLYCLIQSFFHFNKKKTIIGIGVFAILIEISQAFQLLEKLNLQENSFAKIVLGNTFDFNDIWAYVIGCVIVYFLEFYDDNSQPRRKKKLFF